MEDLTQFIDEVKRANDIVDVIGSYIEIRKKGTSFMARCPFHGEKTPSFSVNQRNQFYHCFGCGESGDVLKFVEKYESCSFMEALEILARRAGIKMPEGINGSEKNSRAEMLKKQKETHLNILRETARFYYHMLRTSYGENALNYMHKRGFTDDTLKTFGIGYSPDNYKLVDYLQGKQFKLKDCVDCGVLHESNGRQFDALSGRLIVPILNMRGQVIAFGGRALDERQMAFGKYQNTQETSLFSKKDNLFGINIVKEQKQQAALPNIVIVEGYMDVIAMNQFGFKRAVASMGTSLTENQAKMLTRLTETVYVCYDGDSAGQKATVRGMDILDSVGLDVKVMSVPREDDVKDPDEYIKKYGADAFEKLIAEALPLPDYKLMLLDNAFDIRSANQAIRNDALAKYVKGAVKMLKQLDDVRQAQYITVVTQRTGYSEEYLRRKLTETTVSDTDSAVETTPASTTMTAETKAKFFVASCMLNNQDFATLDEKPSTSSAFLEQLFSYIFECKQNGTIPRVDMMYTVCTIGTNEDYSMINEVNFSKENYQRNKEYFDECVVLIKRESLKLKRDSLTRQLATSTDADNIYKQIEDINHKLKELH